MAGLDAVRRRLMDLPQRVGERLDEAMGAVAASILEAARQNLSGAVLPARSGRLRDSLRIVTANDGGGMVSATVAADAPYAAAQEYGFTGTVDVRAHLRLINEAFGRSLRRGTEAVAVRAYPMRMNLPARAYLRSALASQADTVHAELAQAVAQAIRE